MLGNKILEARKSKFNGEILVKRTWGLGTYLQVGGVTQSGKIIESIWKPVVKKLNAKNSNTKSILILGLGGGTVAKLLRKTWPNAKITGVEIDPVMVEMGKKYLGLGNYDVDIKIADAKNFNAKRYDLIIVDTYLGKKQINLNFKNLTKNTIVLINKLGEVGDFEEKLKSTFSSIEVVKPLVNTVFICEK